MSNVPAIPLSNVLVIQKQQIDGLNATLKQFKEMDAIVVGNETYVTAPPPTGFIHSWEVVNCCPDPRFKEVYPQKGGGLSFTAVFLKKLSKAMGIRFGPGEIVSRTYDAKNRTQAIIYRSTACVRGLDGQYSWSQMDYEFDLEKRAEEIENTYDEKIEKWQTPEGRAAAPPNFKVLQSDQKVKAWRDEKVRIEMIQIEKNALTRAQTGSMTRCIRDLGPFQSTYLPEQLAKPILIPKLIVYYDPVNPIDRAFALEQTKVPMMMFPKEQARVALPEPSAQTPQELAIEAQAPAIAAGQYNLPSETEKLDLEQMMEPEETEMEPQAEEVAIQTDPSETAMMDFEACDDQEKLKAVEQQIKMKAWAGHLNKLISAFTPNELRHFYMMLVKLPMPESTQTQMPWSNS